MHARPALQPPTKHRSCTHATQEAKADGEPNSGALPMLLPVTHEEAAPSIPPLAPPPSPAAGPRGIPPCYTRAYMTQLIMPQHANSLGITFGGQVMKYVVLGCAHPIHAPSVPLLGAGMRASRRAMQHAASVPRT